MTYDTELPEAFGAQPRVCLDAPFRRAIDRGQNPDGFSR